MENNDKQNGSRGSKPWGERSGDSRGRSYERKPFNRDGEGRSSGYSNNSYRRYNKEGENSEREGSSRRMNTEGTERRPFRRFDDKGGEGREFKPRRRFNSENGERRPFNRDNNGENRPRRFDSENGERRSFNRDNNGENRPRRFDNENGERRPFNRGNDEGRPRRFGNDSGERRSFGRDNDRFGGNRGFRSPRFGDSKFGGKSEKNYERPTEFVSIDKNLLNRIYDDEWSDTEVLVDYEMPQEEEVEIKQPATEAEGYRINRFISGAGVCSRRAADDYIANGKITLNGTVVTDFSTKVFPGDEVCLDGKKLTSQKLVYIVFNKPKDCICTKSDELGRRTIYDYIKSDVEVKNVGRLDRDTTGVMLLTNDGDLIERLSHPRYNKMKIYHVFLNKNLSTQDLETIKGGVDLEMVLSEDGTEQKGGHIDVDDIQYVEGEKNQVGIQIHSGLYHVVRRIFEKYGYTVEKLDRVYFSGLTKRDLPRGRWRFLSQKEVTMLKRGAFA